MAEQEIEGAVTAYGTKLGSEYRAVMAIIMAHAMILRGNESEKKITRADMRWAIYSLEGMFIPEGQERQDDLPGLFLDAKTECWNSIWEMIDEGQLIEGCDDDDEGMFAGYVRIVPDSLIEKAIKEIFDDETVCKILKAKIV